MEKIIKEAIEDFLTSVEDFSVNVALAVDSKQKKAKVCRQEACDGQWTFYPIKDFIKLNDKGFLEPNAENVARLAEKLS